MRTAVRVLTYNVLNAGDADGARRQAALRAVIRDARADVVALQEVTRSDGFDQAAELLGPDFTIVDVPGWSAERVGECLGTSLPVERVEVLDEPVAGDARAAAAAVEVVAPIGRVLVIQHKGTYERDREGVREQQALATARFADALVAGRRDLPVILLGDFNGEPTSAALRFLTGRQSLDGMSTFYADAWEACHPDQPGHTFTPENPLVPAGEMPLERGRRIDHVLVRGGAHGPLLDVVAVALVGTEPVGGVQPSDHYGVVAELRAPGHPPGTWATR
jgi:endonuclease/exonuclease/phosphatase family metal-dependent hydrolase